MNPEVTRDTRSWLGLREKWCRRAAAGLMAAAVLGGGVEASADVFHGHWIKGRIEQTFHRLGGHGRFGNATTNELDAARGGKFQVFARDASIYWHPRVSNGVARQVGGRIREKWGDLRWENGFLRYPTTDETVTPDRVGRFNHFQGGSIYWSPKTDAHQIGGAIFDKWASLGYEGGDLGYPTTDESTPPDRTGRFNHFERGSIYFHPSHGTHQIVGPIRDKWKELGWETGRLGYPTSDPYSVEGGVRQDFVGGAIQRVVPTGVSLPKYDGRAYSSYRHIRPLFTKAENPEISVSGLAREVASHMDAYFPMEGCPQVLVAGAVCTFSYPNGQDGTATVERIGDSGFVLETLPGHPEGEGRLLTVRFDTAVPVQEVAGDQSEILFDSSELESAYRQSDKPWLRLVIEVSGPTATTRVAGPFSSDHRGRQVFAGLSRAVRSKVPQSSTLYIAR